MTNYDILKEYEAHQTPVPSYEEWKALNCNMDNVIQTNQVLCKKLKIALDTLSEIEEKECSASYMAYVTLEHIKELKQDGSIGKNTRD